MYNKYLKRVLDFWLAFIFILLLSPVFILVIILCYINFKGIIFFTQERVGRNENIFTILKFTTMRPFSTTNNTDNSRLTQFGRLLRKSSLDEIPQLINILKGDMSLIGPRPLLVKYLQYYTPEEKIRHQVRPGITGLAQINGRNNLTWNDRLQFDIQYVKNLSLALDLNIFFNTIGVIFRGKNIQPDASLELKDLDVERKPIIIADNKNKIN